jgi:RND family efflux transporter MFP subunit
MVLASEAGDGRGAVAEKSDLLRSLRFDRESETETSRAPGVGVLGIVSIGLAAALAGGVIAWFAKPAPPAPAPAAQEAQDGQTAASPPAPAAGGLVASGYVVARRQATVAAEVTGRVLEVRVEEGQTVRRGDILAVLEPTLARAELNSAVSRSQAAEAELVEARRALARTQALAKQNYASPASLQTAEARLDTAAAQRNASRSEAARAAAQLARYQIRAPFSGVVINKAAQPGEIISPVSAGGGFTRTGICTIVDMESLEIEVDVSEAYISRVSPDQRVQAVLDAYPEMVLPAHVIATIPAASRDRATFRVRIGFDRLDPRILPEMAIKVTFLEPRT